MTKATTLALTTALALSSTMGRSSMSMFGRRFAASCGCHDRFTVWLAFALPVRGGLPEAGISSLSSLPVAQSYDACMKAQRMGNLAPAHVISAHGCNVPNRYASSRSECSSGITFSRGQGCLSARNSGLIPRLVRRIHSRLGVG